MSNNLWITGNGSTVGFGLNEDSQTTRSASSTGGGGWQIVDRPRRGVSTEWTDFGQYQLTMNLIMDSMFGQSTPTSLEPAIAAVEAWELPAPGSSPPLPPTVRVSGPVPHTELPYIVYTLTWGNAIRNPTAASERWYQELQLVLWEYRPTVLTVTGPGGSPATNSAAVLTGTGSGTSRTYIVKPGDTLQSVASTLLGSWTAWTQIAAANGLRDPNTVTPGQRLAIP